jgi:hypothetical protein
LRGAGNRTAESEPVPSKKALIGLGQMTSGCYRSSRGEFRE